MHELAELHGASCPILRWTIRANVPVARGLGRLGSGSGCGCGRIMRLQCLGSVSTSSNLHSGGWKGMRQVGCGLFRGAILAVAGMSHAILHSNGDDLGLIAVTFFSQATSATWAARAALPSTVPLPMPPSMSEWPPADSGGFDREPEAIAAGMRDRQPTVSRPASSALDPDDRCRPPGGAGRRVLSGAGPTILTLVEPDTSKPSAGHMRMSRPNKVAGEVKPLTPTRAAFSIEHF